MSPRASDGDLKYPLLSNLCHTTWMLNGTFPSPSRTKSYARTLRKKMTRAERRLWNVLRAKRFHGFKFRRQVPLGPYIVDFLCVEKKLIIEVDGYSHVFSRRRDERRDVFFMFRDFKVLRFSNQDVYHNMHFVLQTLREHLGMNDFTDIYSDDEAPSPEGRGSG